MVTPIVRKQVTDKFYHAEDNTSQKTLKSEPKILDFKKQEKNVDDIVIPHSTKRVAENTTDPYSNDQNNFTFNKKTGTNLAS